MEIKYTWPTSGTNPREVNGVTLDQQYVPREGELISLNVEVEPDEWVSKEMRVKDVIWQISHKGQKATVICS